MSESRVISEMRFRLPDASRRAALKLWQIPQLVYLFRRMS